MMKRASVVLLGCLALPVSSFAQSTLPATSTTPALPFIEIANGYQKSSSGPDARFVTTQAVLLVSPAPLARRGLSIVGNGDLGYGMLGWTVGARRSWARRLTTEHEVFLNGYAQLSAGRMQTAVKVANGYGGTVVQPSVGIAVTYKAIAAFVQVDYRVAPARPDALATRVADTSGPRLLVGSGWRFGLRDQPDAKRAPNATSAAPAHHDPRVELTLGFNGPQYWTAEFPGISFSAAANVIRSRNWGAAIVAEGDASYVRVSRSLGARVFARTSNLESGGHGVTAWLQVLGGYVDGGRQGIIVSNGGTLVQPGVGVAIGSAKKSFVVQIDRQNVSGGVIHDEMRGDVAAMGRTRKTLGFVWRFRDR